MLHDHIPGFGWPQEAGQFDVRNVSEEDLARWEETARYEAGRMIPGEFNWPMAVRSLCAEVRRLRQERGG